LLEFYTLGFIVLRTSAKAGKAPSVQIKNTEKGIFNKDNDAGKLKQLKSSQEETLGIL
jgi:hypothetical protein